MEKENLIKRLSMIAILTTDEETQKRISYLIDDLTLKTFSGYSITSTGTTNTTPLWDSINGFRKW